MKHDTMITAKAIYACAAMGHLMVLGAGKMSSAALADSAWAVADAMWEEHHKRMPAGELVVNNVVPPVYGVY